MDANNASWWDLALTVVFWTLAVILSVIVLPMWAIWWSVTKIRGAKNAKTTA